MQDGSAIHMHGCYLSAVDRLSSFASRRECSVPGSSQTNLTFSGGLDFTMGYYLGKIFSVIVST